MDFVTKSQYYAKDIADLLQQLGESQSDAQFAVHWGRINSRSEPATREEVVLFLLWHLPEVQLRSFHAAHKLTRWNQSQINFDEFALILKSCFGFLKVTLSDSELRTLFQEVDTNRDGWVEYGDFFEFCQHYLAGKMVRAPPRVFYGHLVDLVGSGINTKVIDEGVRAKYLSQFAELLRRAIRLLIGRYSPGQSQFDRSQVEQFFSVLGLSGEELSFALEQFFKYDKNSDSSLSMEEFINYVIEIFIAEILLLRHQKEEQNPGLNVLHKNYFFRLFLDACMHLGLKPGQQDLEQLYVAIDTDNNGEVSFPEYYHFVREHLMFIIDKPSKALSDKDLTHHEKTFKNEFVRELYALFKRFDLNDDEVLDRAEFEELLRVVLKENTQAELNYVFWNLFRADTDGSNALDFQEFARFILMHSAEMAMQRFHVYQTTGSRDLTIAQYKLLVRNAYWFVQSVQKDDQLLEETFKMIDAGRQGKISYSDFMGWVNNKIRSRI